MKNTKEDLKLYFKLLDFHAENWGVGTAKTLDHLVLEIDKGETRLNGVFRAIRTVAIDVICDKQKLREVCQVFSDGRIRKREFEFGSVCEKLNGGETPLQGLWRGLEEELGIKYNSQIRFKYIEEKTMIFVSNSYPGLVTRNTQSRFRVKLPREFYRVDGYFERQSDKTTYFEWVDVQNVNIKNLE